MKIEDDEVYEKAVNGEYTGFSVEAYIDTELSKLGINKKSEQTMEKKTLKEKFLKFVDELFLEDTDVKLAEYVTEDGQVITTDEEGKVTSPSDLKAGEYTLDDGSTLIVDEEGNAVVKEEVEEVVDEVAEEEMTEETVEQAEEEEEEEVEEEVVEEEKEEEEEEELSWTNLDFENLQKEKTELESEVEKLKAEIESLKAELEKAPAPILNNDSETKMSKDDFDKLPLHAQLAQKALAMKKLQDEMR